MTAFTCIFNYIRKHKALTLLTVGVIAATVVAVLLPPQVLKALVDRLVNGEVGEGLLTFALLYTGSYVLMGLLELAKAGLLVCVSQGIAKELRCSMLRHVNRMTYQNFVRFDSAALEAYFNNDVAVINTLITSGVISIAIDMFKVVGIVITIFTFSWRFGLMVLVLLPVLAAFAMFVKKRMFISQLQARQYEGIVNHLIYENVENMEAIKLYDTDYSVKKYENVLKKHFKVSEQAVFYIAVFPPVMDIIKDIIIVALILLSGYQGGFFGMSVGAVVSTITLLGDLFNPIENLGMELQTIQKSMAGMRRINEFFALEEDELQEAVVGNADEIELAFDNVSFHYEEGKDVLHDFSLRMKGVDKVTLRGPSGAGKSTLFKLAYGLLRPTAGRVTINGVDTYKLSEESRQRLFGMVYQDPFFSGGSIYEELTMHRDISQERVRRALEQAGLSRITDVHAPFAEHDFSTGELSLLNIVRIMLTDCRVLFLDEMNARIDPETARRIMGIMNEIGKDKMILSINHYGEMLEGASVMNMGGGY